MEPSSVVTESWSLSTKWGLGLGVLGLLSIAVLIYCCCCKKKDHEEKERRRSSLNSIESFQQLYFTNTPYSRMKNVDHRVIERWTSADQPSMTFYRSVYIQDNPDDLYQPVTEERLRMSVDQSKAMEYADEHESYTLDEIAKSDDLPKELQTSRFSSDLKRYMDD